MQEVRARKEMMLSNLRQLLPSGWMMKKVWMRSKLEKYQSHMWWVLALRPGLKSKSFMLNRSALNPLHKKWFHLYLPRWSQLFKTRKKGLWSKLNALLCLETLSLRWLMSRKICIRQYKKRSLRCPKIHQKLRKALSVEEARKGSI